MTAVLGHDGEVRKDEWERHLIFGAAEPGDPDRWIFHYTSLSKAAAMALTRAMLLSPLAVLNDPQESTVRPIMTMTSGDLERRPRHVGDDERRAVEEALARLRREMRVGCFTRDAAVGAPATAARFDGRGYARPRLWAQYGDAHRGACLVLDRDVLEANVRRQFPPGQLTMRAIDYVAGFNDSLHAAEMVDFDRPDPERHFQAAVVESLFCKNADWAGEREYRIALSGHSGATCEVPLEGSVVGLVLGVAFEAHLLPVARRIAEAFDVVESTAHLSLNNAVLDPAPIIGPDGDWHIWSAQDHRCRGRVYSVD